MNLMKLLGRYLRSWGIWGRCIKKAITYTLKDRIIIKKILYKNQVSHFDIVFTSL